MDIDPDEVLDVELRWNNGELTRENYSRDITRRQLGDLLLRIDDMATDTEIAGETTC